MKSVRVNHWPCIEVEGAQIAAIIQPGEWSRIVLELPHVSLLDGLRLHLPDESETRAVLNCLGHLCATGQECSKKSPWILSMMFPGFKQEVNP